MRLWVTVGTMCMPSKIEHWGSDIPTTAYVNFINTSKLHCRLDFFTYRNLFQNEISDDFSSKSLLKLLIHSNAHVHNYQSRKKDEFWSLKSGFGSCQAQFYWNHMGS